PARADPGPAAAGQAGPDQGRADGPAGRGGEGADLRRAGPAALQPDAADPGDLAEHRAHRAGPGRVRAGDRHPAAAAPVRWAARPQPARRPAPALGYGEASRLSCGGSWLAAARSSRNKVRSWPRAPAAGTWTGPASDSARR